MAAKERTGACRANAQIANCPPDQHQGTCPAEKFDHWGKMNPRGPEMRLFCGQ